MNGLGCLVDDVAFVLVSQHIFAYESVQIDVHKLEQDVNISLVCRTDNFLQLDDVGVFEFSKKHNLPVSSLSVRGILESIKILFKRVKLPTSPLLNFPNDTVSTTSDFLQNVESFADVWLDFLVVAHNNYQ